MRRSLGRIVFPAASLIMLGGCTQSRHNAPDRSELDAFIQRRAFAVAAVTQVPPPMEGTSYAGDHELVMTLAGVYGSDDYVRRLVGSEKSYSASHWPGTEFDVVLSEELVKSTNIATIATRLRWHYAAKLIEAGWHPIGGGEHGHPAGTPEASRYWEHKVWTDLGRGVTPNPGRPLTDFSYSYTPDDVRRGFFRIYIGVTVDTESRRAHVLLLLHESIGYPNM
jgi:hypothetical protein